VQRHLGVRRAHGVLEQLDEPIRKVGAGHG
jgi:hypothetical protein